MGYVEAAMLIISLASLAASYYLAKDAAKKQRSVGDQVTTLTNRGDFVPVVIGTRRIGYLFGWAGNRRSDTEGGGGKGSGGGDGATVWYEDGWHILSAGTGLRLKGIYANNRRVGAALGVIDRTTSPSGTTFTIPFGTFTIYWGEDDQPVNTYLASKLGHGANHGGMAFILWRNVRLGSSPTWAQIEYVWEADCPNLTLDNSEYYVGTGINLAHAMLQLLCAPRPHGNGLPASAIDETTMEAFGELMEAEDIGINMVIQGGEKAQNIIGTLLQDAGCLMPQIGPRLGFLPNRYTGDPVPTFDLEIIVPPDYEREINHDEEDVTRTTFTFKNATNNSYRDTDIKFDDDGEAGAINKAVDGDSAIDTVTDGAAANVIARRRSMETSNTAAFKVTALRGASRLSAGQMFNHHVAGLILVMGVTPKAQSPEAELDVVPSIYAVPDIDDVGEPGGGGVDPLDPGDDIGLTWFELPEELQTGSQTQIVVLRTRAHNQMEGAYVMVSADSSSYLTVGQQVRAAAGGLIETAIASGDADPIVDGPIFEDDNGDAQFITDYSGDDVAWEAGVQIAVINDEIFFLQYVTLLAENVWLPSTNYSVGDYVIPTGSTGFRYRCVTAGTSLPTEPTWPTVKGDQVTEDGVGSVPTWEARYFKYQMHNMTRAEYGSVAADHAVDDRVFIIPQAGLQPFASPLFTTGANVCVKTQPYSPQGVANTSLEVCKTLS